MFILIGKLEKIDEQKTLDETKKYSYQINFEISILRSIIYLPYYNTLF